MEHILPNLPYAYDSLEPYIDARTMEIHYSKHHQAYINNLKVALKEYIPDSTLDVEQLLRHIDAVPDAIRTVIRNHGGGHANHSFFWPTLKTGVTINGPILEAINRKFGSFAAFKDQFSAAAIKLFGSGWAWLVVDNGELRITTTANQDSPIMFGQTPVLGVDVWEHTYYLLYQNRRPEYLANFFNVINWEKINEHYQNATR